MPLYGRCQKHTHTRTHHFVETQKMTSFQLFLYADIVFSTCFKFIEPTNVWSNLFFFFGVVVHLTDLFNLKSNFDWKKVWKKNYVVMSMVKSPFDWMCVIFEKKNCMEKSRSKSIYFGHHRVIAMSEKIFDIQVILYLELALNFRWFVVKQMMTESVIWSY